MDTPETIYLRSNHTAPSMAGNLVATVLHDREDDIPYDRRKTCRWWYRDDIGVHQRACDGVVGRYDEREPWCGGCGGHIEIKEATNE